jgi:hypothetical protein
MAKKAETPKPKRKLSEGLKKWQNHLASVRKDNPGKSLKECMTLAKKTYKK